LARPLDISQRPNLAIVALVGALAMIALVRWLDGEPPDVFTAPVHCYLIWAVLREIDPDHNWTALAGGAVAGAWVLAGGPGISLWLLAGLILGARITTATTGRRPLPTDLAVVAVVAVAIGFRPEGWAAGFGLAVAVYLDERFSGANRHWVSALAAAMAVATTVVANLTDAFGDTAPEVIPWVALAAGVVALALLVREPAVPVSQVDARHSAFMDQGRLHTSRAMVGLVVFVAAVLAGTAAEGMVPVLVALGLAVLSNEVEVIFRRRSG
jgi:hypothetical protein